MKKFLKDYGAVVTVSIFLIGAFASVISMNSKMEIRVDNLEYQSKEFKDNLECQGREFKLDFKESATCINDINKKLSNIEGKIDIMLRSKKNHE